MDDAELVERWRRLPPELHRPWFRCEYPERPPDPNVQWHYTGCRACEFAARRAFVDDPSNPQMQVLARLMRFE